MNPQSAINAFLKLYIEDRDQGRVRVLEEYVALWPDHAAPITEEFTRLSDDATPPAIDAAREVDAERD